MLLFYKSRRAANMYLCEQMIKSSCIFIKLGLIYTLP